MPTNVPTWDEFVALEKRVAVIENDSPPIVAGTQAERITSLFRFGVNTFSSLDEHNIWGSWPADYRPDSVIAALRWIVQDTGHTISIREYHYAGRENMQRQWLTEIHAAFPNQRNTICIGANGSPTDVSSMLSLYQDSKTGLYWIEGLNEPNTNFGSGTVPVETTIAIQRGCSEADSVMGSSVVAGMPHPEGWITGYFGDQLTTHNSLLNYGNGHYYPPYCPDLYNDGCSILSYVVSLDEVYDAAMVITEFHPTLFNSEGYKPDQPGWSGSIDTYYTLLTLFRCARSSVPIWWYALFDYGTVYRCGLYPVNADDPREVAYALRALCSICADTGDDRLTFDPGTLEYSVNGADNSVSHDLYQSSDGTFFIVFWRSLAAPGDDVLNIEFEFEQMMNRIEEFDLCLLAEEQRTDNYTPIQVVANNVIVSQLDGSARVLRITQ